MWVSAEGRRLGAGHRYKKTFLNVMGELEEVLEAIQFSFHFKMGSQRLHDFSQVPWPLGSSFSSHSQPIPFTSRSQRNLTRPNGFTRQVSSVTFWG